MPNDTDVSLQPSGEFNRGKILLFHTLPNGSKAIIDRTRFTYIARFGRL